jgi:8-oxo-dGTP pyrophosphatase MutT (NUDIX family)
MKHESKEGVALGKIVTKRRNGSLRTDYLFRISLKAVIYNEKGELLVVKEHGLNWGLPGGGMDFGETFETALARELEEEVGYKDAFTFDIINVADPMYLENIDAWQVYIVCRVNPEHFAFTKGVDAEDMRFIDPEELTQYDDTQAQYAHHFHTQLQKRA